MSLPIILRIFKGEHIVEVKQLQLDQILIGNQAAVNIHLDDPSVTSIHAMIERRDEVFYLGDLGSATGTLKNGKPVLDEVIESGDSFHIGPYRIQFLIGAPRPRQVAPDLITPEVIEAALVPQSPITQSPQAFVQAPVPASAQEDSIVTANIDVSSNIQSPIQQDSVVTANNVSLNSGKFIEGSIASNVEKINGTQDKKTIEIDKRVSAEITKARPNLVERSFVPPVALPEENAVIKPSKGSVLEVSVAWRERIIDTYHFRGNKAIVVGSGEKVDIQLPKGVFRGNHTIADFNHGVASVQFRSEMTGSLILEMHNRDFSYLKEKGRLSSNTKGNDVLRLEQGEALRISLVPGLINIYIRYVPSTKKPNLLPFIPFTPGEVASVVVATALVGLLAFYNAIHAPIETPEEKLEPEIISVTKFVYPTVKPPPEPVPPVTKAPEPPPVKEIPKPVKKVVMGEKTQAGSEGAKAPGAKSSSGSAGSRAAEAAPNSNKNAQKKFTSVNQGGGVKLGAQAGANAAQSNKEVDLTDVGLVSAFGGGGARSKLSKAVHGAGDVIGDSTKATGYVGFGKDRPGEDLGSAFKSDGAGGKGVATEGISGGITNGRGSGNAGYGGVGSGLGDKGGVGINVGGEGESITGTIDKNGVRRVILSKQAVIRRCYEKELRFKKSLGGRVLMLFEINEKGQVNYAKVDSSSLGDVGVENCLKNELVTWQFPEAPAGSVAEVRFPFNFQPKD